MSRGLGDVYKRQDLFKLNAPAFAFCRGAAYLHVAKVAIILLIALPLHKKLEFVSSSLNPFILIMLTFQLFLLYM